jgi:hypothetical protein
MSLRRGADAGNGEATYGQGVLGDREWPRAAMAMMAAWWLATRRALTRHVLIVDGLLAVALGAAAAAGSLDAAADAGPGVRPVDGVGLGLVALAASGLVVRRRLPVLAFAVSYGVALVYLLARYPYSPVVQLAAVTLYSLGAWRPPRVSAAACVIALLVPAMTLDAGARTWWPSRLAAEGRPEGGPQRDGAGPQVPAGM